MVKRRILLLTLLFARPGAAIAGSLDRWSDEVREASARFAIPESWIRKVMHAESGGKTWLNGHPIRSSAGAIGLMQLMPGTWDDMREAYGLGPDPDDPRDNILAGAAYLRAMYDRFGYPGLFAAYNAGPARYAQHLASGRRLPHETIAIFRNSPALRPRRPMHHGLRLGSSLFEPIPRRLAKSPSGRRRSGFSRSGADLRQLPGFVSVSLPVSAQR